MKVISNKTNKKALITGITGQDGSYLAELLLEKGYEVHGLIRRASTFNTSRIDHIYKDPHFKGAKLHLHYGDLSDASNISRLLMKVQPDEIYNLGAQSHVRVSFDMPEYTSDVVALGSLRILDAIRDLQLEAKYYQASSSEMFGKVENTKVPLTENIPFYPRSPYGVAKLFAHWSTINYRESYDMFACCGIIFNHESPRRGHEFVTRKITHTAARINYNQATELRLGNLDAKRDWSHAADMAEAMWMMLQHHEAKDFVFASGETHTVREFVELAFGRMGMDYQKYVKIDPKFFRPAEVEILLGDASLAHEELGWKPKISFEQLVHDMVDADMRLIGNTFV
jgi:GDPmannose 4,6-dehydratase